MPSPALPAGFLGPVGRPDVEGGYATTHLLVRVRQGVTAATLADGRLTFAPREFGAVAESMEAAGLLGDARVAGVVPLFPNLAHAAAAARFGLDRTYRVDLPVGTDTPSLAARLATLRSLFELVELDGIGGVADLPNDPQLPQQYGMHNTGQTAGGIVGVPDADVDQPEAWSLGVDTSGVTIAVLDSGVNQHVELAGRIQPGFNVPDGTTITDDECSSHGTHVSGILAAATNNGVGVVGMAPQAAIKPWVVVNPCSGFESWVATALTDATDLGLRLVNMSLQYYTGTQTLRDAVLYAAASDVIMVAAAGNNGNQSIAFPARWPEPICVSAVQPDGTFWPTSNYGPEVDLAAPGYSIHSTTGTTTYGLKSGTSMSAPFVTGTIALMLGKNPTLTAAQVRAILQATTDDVDVAGFDIYTGFGRVNAHAALLATPSPNPGDLDGDGLVGPSDLALLLGAWGDCADCEIVPCFADLDGDCQVGPADLALLLGSWS